MIKLDDLPEGWALAVVADVTSEVASVAADDEPSREFGYVDISAIDNRDFRIEVSEVKRFKGRDAPSRARRPIRPNDVLFSNVRTYLRNIALVPGDLDAQLCSTGFTVLRTNGTVEPRYLLRWVLTDAFINAVSPQQTGTHYPATSDRVVMSQVTPVPPLAEQRRIVAKVEALLAQVHAARERLANVPAILKRFRQCVHAAACSGQLTKDWRDRQSRIAPVTKTLDGLEPAGQKTPAAAPHHGGLPELPDVPETWAIVAVGSVVSQVQYGINTRADVDPSRGIPVLRMGNIQDGRIDAGDLKYVTRGKELGGYKLRRGDILFNRTNSPELVGKAAVFDRNDEMVFASYLLRVRAKPEVVLPDHLCGWINSPWGRHWARVVRTDGVSQSNINATKLAEMPLPLPPVEEQQEIVRRVEALFALADTIDKRVAAAVARVEKLTQAILAEAFRGELVPTEADWPGPRAVVTSRLRCCWSGSERRKRCRNRQGGSAGSRCDEIDSSERRGPVLGGGRGWAVGRQPYASGSLPGPPARSTLALAPGALTGLRGPGGPPWKRNRPYFVRLVRR